MTNQDKNLNILRTERDFKVKQKAFFIIFKGLSVAKNCLIVPLIKLHFVNKGMGMINISKITIDKNMKKILPTQFNKTEQISTVYTSTKTIRSKIHKEFIKTLNTKNILKTI